MPEETPGKVVLPCKKLTKYRHLERSREIPQGEAVMKSEKIRFYAPLQGTLSFPCLSSRLPIILLNSVIY